MARRRERCKYIHTNRKGKARSEKVGGESYTFLQENSRAK
jgi:hypothetical protein